MWRQIAGLSFVALTSCLALTSCAHPNRISRDSLQRLTNNREPIVLVFGSLSTPPGTLTRPAIRFLQANPSAPAYLLRELIISSGDRFYAILEAPKVASDPLPWLDEF